MTCRSNVNLGGGCAQHTLIASVFALPRAFFAFSRFTRSGLGVYILDDRLNDFVVLFRPVIFGFFGHTESLRGIHVEPDDLNHVRRPHPRRPDLLKPAHRLFVAERQRRSA